MSQLPSLALLNRQQIQNSVLVVRHGFSCWQWVMDVAAKGFLEHAKNERVGVIRPGFDLAHPYFHPYK